MKLRNLSLLMLLMLVVQNMLAEVIPLSENVDVKNQIKGNFGSMSRKESLPLGAIQHVWDKSCSTVGVYEIDYKQNEIIKLRVREHMMTTVELPIWEHIEKIVVGDEGTVKAIAIKNNIVVFEPQDFVGVDTSVTVICKGYLYLFYVRVEGYNSKSPPDIGVKIRAFPPHNFNKTKSYTKKRPASKDYLEEVITRPEDLNFNFSMSGSKDIAPKLVYSDGFRTWLYYGNSFRGHRLPAVFFVLDGVDTPVNSSRIKNSIVVQGSGVFTLKNGSSITCIYPTRERA